MYKIAFIAEDYPPNQGGISEYSKNLLIALVEQGHEVRVVSAHVTGDSNEDSGVPFAIARIGEKDIRRKKLGLWSRYKANKSFQDELDIWYEDNYRNDTPDFAIVCSVSSWADVCKRWNIPYAICVHGGDAFGKRTDFIRSFYRLITVRKILQGAKLICANSDFTAQQLRNKIHDIGARVITTYCGISEVFKKTVEAAMIAKDNDETAKVTLLMMCRFVPIKACDVVIYAIEKLQKKHSDIVLNIAGDGPLKDELEALAREIGVSDRVNFIGYVDDLSRKAELFLQSDLYVQTGRIDPQEGRPEAFGIVFAEAGACNLPVIGPRIGGVPEVILDGETGYLVEPDSVDSLVTAIDRILCDCDKSKSMGIAGRKYVYGNFDYRVISKNITSRMS